MKKSEVFIVRCSEDERNLLKDLAKDMGFSVSQLVRWLVKQESERRHRHNER